MNLLRSCSGEEHICMMSFRYSELFLLMPGLSVVITILVIVFILLRLCRMQYCEGVEIQRHRDTMIYSREDARYFNIYRVADKMESMFRTTTVWRQLGTTVGSYVNKIVWRHNCVTTVWRQLRTTVWSYVNKIAPLLRNNKLIIPMMKVKITHCVWCEGKKMKAII